MGIHGKKPFGPATKFTANSNSRGGEYNINNIYHTRYNNEFGTRGQKTFGYEHFVPRPGRPVGTGYASNIRPQIFYKQSLDELDNPWMGKLLSGNYESITRRHYKESYDPTGKEHFPGTVYRNGHITGFTEQPPLNIPIEQVVRAVNYDTREYGGQRIPGIDPKKRIHLKKIQRKDAVENENYCHGPAYMKTEVRSQFKGARPQVNSQGMDVSKNEDSGWVVNRNIEPITFTEEDAFHKDLSDMSTTRPTGTSTMKDNFVTYKDQCGREVFPTITDTSVRWTGYIRDPNMRTTTSDNKRTYASLEGYPAKRAEEVKKNDPQEYSNLKYMDKKITTIQTQYKGKQRPARVMEQIINTESTGNKQLSGDCWNNVRYEPTKNTDPKRYLTNYNMRHYDMNPQGINREGWTMGGTLPAQRDGYIHNSNVHTWNGKNLDENKRLYTLNPFVSKTIKHEDRFYGEKKNYHKLKPHGHDHYYKVEPLSTATLETSVM